ncbi:MAG: DNA repair protein RadA [Clostridia bacterium]|nr:DNA repair protein RadA [Clostridia bacterium]
MAKGEKTVFVCGECGYESGKWLGQCPVCSSWNTMIEETLINKKSKSAVAFAKAQRLDDVEVAHAQRQLTGLGELDRVLGGGAVKGSTVLLGGDPGIGKSTLLMQMASNLSEKGKVLYVTGEESVAQLKIRAQRLSLSGSMLLLAETNLDGIEAEISRIKPEFIIIDSIQTMYSSAVSSAPGSVTQVREATGTLTRLAKTEGYTVFIVGHVTKDGAIAGPRVLEHMVDTVLYFEGDRHDSFRLLRTVKNRFGSTNEIGVFEMCDKGMTEVKDPSKMFVSGKSAPGCAVTCIMEGTRPMLVEVQTLLAPSPFNNPRRMAAGIDSSRLMLLLAVLEKKVGLKLYDKDVYTNVVGGIRIEERAGDLATAVCIASALADKPLLPSTAIIGEISLTGEIRSVSRTDKRVQECIRLGYNNIIIPKTDNIPKADGVKITQAATLVETVQMLLHN